MRTRYRVLVVDDNNDTVETISTVLESAGFDVIPADSGSACRQLIETCDPDILILDVMLDTLTEGLTVYCDIRGNPRFDDIPIILISAIDREIGFPIDLNSASKDVFLEKPIDPSYLVTSIEHLIGCSENSS